VWEFICSASGCPFRSPFAGVRNNKADNETRNNDFKSDYKAGDSRKHSGDRSLFVTTAGLLDSDTSNRVGATRRVESAIHIFACCPGRVVYVRRLLELSAGRHAACGPGSKSRGSRRPSDRTQRARGLREPAWLDGPVFIR